MNRQNSLPSGVTFLWELKENVRRAVGRGCSVNLGLKEAAGVGACGHLGQSLQASGRE